MENGEERWLWMEVGVVSEEGRCGDVKWSEVGYGGWNRKGGVRGMAMSLKERAADECKVGRRRGCLGERG